MLSRYTPYLDIHYHLIDMLQFSNFIIPYQSLLLEPIPTYPYFPIFSILQITCYLINSYILFNVTYQYNVNIQLQANFALNINT